MSTLRHRLFIVWVIWIVYFVSRPLQVSAATYTKMDYTIYLVVLLILFAFQNENPMNISGISESPWILYLWIIHKGRQYSTVCFDRTPLHHILWHVIWLFICKNERKKICVLIEPNVTALNWKQILCTNSFSVTHSLSSFWSNTLRHTHAHMPIYVENKPKMHCWYTLAPLKEYNVSMKYCDAMYSNACIQTFAICRKFYVHRATSELYWERGRESEESEKNIFIGFTAGCCKKCLYTFLMSFLTCTI